jgi:hypothetical protein
MRWIAQTGILMLERLGEGWKKIKKWKWLRETEIKLL